MARNNRIEILLFGKDVGLTKALSRGQAELRLFSRRAQNAVKPIGSMASAAMSLKTALAGIITAAGLTALTRSVLAASQELDRLRLSFNAITGDARLAGQEMDFVRKTADTLGLDLLTAAKSYKQISAAAQGTALAGKATKDIFTGVAKASTVLGLSAEETSGALYAISQMISKGTVSSEELKQQLGERLPGAFQIAAKAMGVTTEQLGKMLETGEVMATTFLPKFAKALEDRFGKAAVTAANTFTAGSNRITTELFNVKAAFGQAVTNNNFFVEALSRASTGLGLVSSDAKNNAQEWRSWAKQTTLAVLTFAADAADGFNSVYKFLSFLSGSLKLAWAGAVTLGKGFQWLFEQAMRLVGNTEDAEYWAQAQAQSAALIEDAFNGAAQSFDNAERGSQSLEKIRDRVLTLRTDLAKVAATPVIDEKSVEVAEKTKTELVKVGDTWISVEKKISQSTEKTTDIASKQWSGVWEKLEGDGKSAAAAVDKSLNYATRPREVVVKVKEVQARQFGGMIRKLATGGRLAGYGGGDRIPALLEAGEFIIRKEAVRRFGAGVFSALNNLRLPELPRFATGGPVGGAAVSPQPGATYNFHFSFAGQVGQASRQNARELAKMVMAELQNSYLARPA